MLLGQQAQALIPDLNPEPVRTSLHHDGFTADSVPIVELDAAGDCTVVAGLSGNGFKFAPVHGRMLAELVLDGCRSKQPGRIMGRSTTSTPMHLDDEGPDMAIHAFPSSRDIRSTPTVRGAQPGPGG